MEGWRPSFVVGIDFGMTCTGVAYSSEPEWPEPKVIQRWPGRLVDSEIADKVPTQVAYDERDRLIAWGFHCNFTEQEILLEREFKLYLDPDFPDSYADRPSHANAVKYYKDYMRSLHGHLESHFHETVPDWEDRNVEFLFSIPTTWKSPRLTAKMEMWLEEAGFANSHKRRVKVSQTEAEAAAVYVAKQDYKVGDVIMVVDAGGATTDINILELRTRTSERTHLKALNKAEGVNVGSALIDEHARKVVIDRLRALNVNEDEDTLRWMAEDTMEGSNFEIFKCAFDGNEMQMDLYLEVPGMPVDRTTRSRGEQVIIKAAELKGLFDTQVRSMFSKINDQLEALQAERPSEQLKYIVLSGGLGSSKYVQKRLRAEYSNGMSRHANARNLKVLQAPEPQLTVVKGLVMDRVQALRRGVGVYTGKCSRVSYGVLCRLPYDRVGHRGEKVEKDPLDGKKWAEDQIDWLITEGQAVPDDGFLRPYSLKIPEGAESKHFQAQFVMSENPAKDLPPSLRYQGVERLCTVTGNFGREDFQPATKGSARPFKRIRGGLFSREKAHYIADFNLKVVIGSADLRFEIVSKDGRKFNQNHASIRVDWEDAVAEREQDFNSRNIYPTKNEPVSRFGER